MGTCPSNILAKAVSMNIESNSTIAIRRLGNQSLIALTGNASALLLGLPFQIYLARELGLADLGLYGVIEAMAIVVASLLSLGIAPLATRFIPQYLVSRDVNGVHQLLKYGLLILCTLGLVASSAIILVCVFFADFLRIAPKISDLIIVMGLYIPFSLVHVFLVHSLRGFQEIVAVVLVASVGVLVAKIIVTMSLFSFAFPHPVFYAIAVVASQALTIVPMSIVLVGLVKRLGPRLEEDTSKRLRIKSWLGFAGAIYGGRLVTTIFGNLDRIVVASFLSTSSVGVLMVARQIVVIPLTLLQVVRDIVSPFFAQYGGTNDRRELQHLYHAATDWIVRGTSPMLLLLILLPSSVLSIYGEQFAQEGAGALLAFAVSALLHVAAGPVGPLVNMTGHHAQMLKLEILTKLVSTPLYFVLIPTLGVIGAGLIAGIIDVTLNAAALYIAKTRLDIKWSSRMYKKWIMPSVATVLIVFILTLIIDNEHGRINAIGVFALLLASYLAYFVTYVLGGVSDHDRQLAKSLMARFGK